MRTVKALIVKKWFNHWNCKSTIECLLLWLYMQIILCYGAAWKTGKERCSCRCILWFLSHFTRQMAALGLTSAHVRLHQCGITQRIERYTKHRSNSMTTLKIYVRHPRRASFAPPPPKMSRNGRKTRQCEVRLITACHFYQNKTQTSQFCFEEEWYNLCPKIDYGTFKSSFGVVW